MPNYGKRYRSGQRISTGFGRIRRQQDCCETNGEETADEMEPEYCPEVPDVRIHVLNGTLEDAFRHWHQGFRPIADMSQVAVAA
jgi:hypothetical protein